jgi:predicted transcriptional regulator
MTTVTPQAVGASQAACQESLQAVAHVAPSVQTVYCTLYGHEPMTGRQLRDATNLPRRTIYAALQRLKELDVVKERASLRDTRQTFYWVAGQPNGSTPAVPQPPAPASSSPTPPPPNESYLPAWAVKRPN